MEKINVAELLRNCPKGMELDCTAFNNVKFQCADNDGIWIEYIDSDNNNRVIYLTCEGGIKIKNIETKCVIFPKGKTTWEGFVPPCKFKDGDIAASNDGLFIGIVKYADADYIYTYCAINKVGSLTKNFPYFFHRVATEEEKAKLFQAIKDNGYKWNVETKTLEKLTPDKFDITTLKPFDKVLVRDTYRQIWIADFFSHIVKEPFGGYRFACIGHLWHQCIPYEGNEHLLGKTDDCDEHFKTLK